MSRAKVCGCAGGGRGTPSGRMETSGFDSAAGGVACADRSRGCAGIDRPSDGGRVGHPSGDGGVVTPARPRARHRLRVGDCGGPRAQAGVRLRPRRAVGRSDATDQAHRGHALEHADDGPRAGREQKHDPPRLAGPRAQAAPDEEFQTLPRSAVLGEARRCRWRLSDAATKRGGALRR